MLSDVDAHRPGVSPIDPVRGAGAYEYAYSLYSSPSVSENLGQRKKMASQPEAPSEPTNA
jgi:hypothetical protein